jgi:hypothetical protein
MTFATLENGATGCTSASDTAGNSYTLNTSVQQSIYHLNALDGILTATLPSGGTITINCASSSTNKAAIGAFFSGIASGSYRDNATTDTSISSASSGWMLAQATTNSVAGELVVGFAQYNIVGTAVTDMFTTVNNDGDAGTGHGYLISYEIAPTTSPLTWTVGLSPNRANGEMVLSYKPSGTSTCTPSLTLLGASPC